MRGSDLLPSTWASASGACLRRSPGQGFYCERSSPSRAFGEVGRLGQDQPAGTLQTLQTSLAGLGGSWLREGSRRPPDPACLRPDLPYQLRPQSIPVRVARPGGVAGRWGSSGLSVRETRVPEAARGRRDELVSR